jgi:hypothetical protein
MEVRDMRRRLALLGTSTSLVLGAAVLAAAPAEARNLGGDEPSADICVRPGNVELRSNQAASAPPCVCVVAPEGRILKNLSRNPTAECPSGVLHFR